MSDSESDIELKSALSKMDYTNGKPPRSPSEDIKNNNKKITTKMMITDALIELKTRKGVSLYAIKKFLTEKYNVNTEKVNYLIKKSLKKGVEDGSFIQMKGIGAAGSFKLANVKVTKPKPIKKNPETANAEKKKVKSKEKESVPKLKKDEKALKKTKKMDIKKTEKDEKTKKKSAKVEKKAKNEKDEVKKKSKISKETKMPAKKRAAMMKRHSIGSIIKPPKMKPKSRA